MKRKTLLALPILAMLALFASAPAASTVPQKAIYDGPYKFIAQDGTVRELRLVVDPSQGGNLIGVHIYDENGVDRATPVRFKMSGTRIAADFPGADPAYVITDSNNQITNGD